MATRKDLANAIRALAMDAVQKANSGHPGMPMGMAEIAVALWDKHYRHNPANPQWSNRDRFLLSNGHGSMLHYALLHLAGYDVSMDDIRDFRQLGTIWAFEVPSDDPAFAAKAFALALERGVLLRPIGNTVYFMPPYVIDEAQFAMLVDAARAIVEAFA